MRYQPACNEEIIRNNRTCFRRAPRGAPTTVARADPNDPLVKAVKEEAEAAKSQAAEEREKRGPKETQYECQICSKVFPYKSGLAAHMRRHTGERPFKCEQCELAFADRGSLVRHGRVHTGTKPYKCRFCGKGFTQSGGLKTHERRHTGEKPFKCEFCTAAFPEGVMLTRHRRTHTGERPHQCEVCLKRFTQMSNLRVHERTVHKLETPTIAGGNAKAKSHLVMRPSTIQTETLLNSDRLQIDNVESSTVPTDIQPTSRQILGRRQSPRTRSSFGATESSPTSPPPLPLRSAPRQALQRRKLPGKSTLPSLPIRESALHTELTVRSMEARITRTSSRIRRVAAQIEAEGSVRVSVSQIKEIVDEVISDEDVCDLDKQLNEISDSIPDRNGVIVAANALQQLQSQPSLSGNKVRRQGLIQRESSLVVGEVLHVYRS